MNIKEELLTKEDLENIETIHNIYIPIKNKVDEASKEMLKEELNKSNIDTKKLKDSELKLNQLLNSYKYYSKTYICDFLMSILMLVFAVIALLYNQNPYICIGITILSIICLLSGIKEMKTKNKIEENLKDFREYIW